MQWLSHPLPELWGIPAFWITRIAEVVQFVSGLVIVIEIVGKDRVEAFARSASVTLKALARAQPLRNASKALWDSSRYFVLANLSFGKRREAYLARINSRVLNAAITLSAGLAALTTVAELIGEGRHGAALLWRIPVLLFIAFSLWMVFIHVVVLNLSQVMLFVVFWPLALLVQLIARGVSRLLDRVRLSQVLLVVSLVLYVVSFALQLAVS